MNVHAPFHQTLPFSAKAKNARAMCFALFSLSQTQRRLAHRAKREAIEAERTNHFDRYAFMRRESDRLWREAKWHLGKARQYREDMQ